MTHFKFVFTVTLFLLGLLIFHQIAVGQDPLTQLPGARPVASPILPTDAKAVPSPLLPTDVRPVPSPLNSTTDVQGVVTDKNGAVVSGATVTITNKLTGQSASASTDSEGRFKLSNVPAGRYDAVISTRGFASFHVLDIRVGFGETTQLNVTMGDDTQPGVVQPTATGSVGGVVSNSRTHRPIEDANVTIKQNGSSESWVVKTDGNGKYEKVLPPGEYKLSAEADGFHPSNEKQAEVRAHHSANQPFRLRPN